MVKHRVKDVKPQWMRFQLIESSASTFTQISAATPIVIPDGTVMEILKVFYDIEGAIALITGDELTFALSTVERTAVPRYNDVGTLSAFRMIGLLTTSGALAVEINGMFDLTDGAGNGPLVGSPQIFASILGVSQPSPLTINFAILYRLVKVSAEELIGIISGN